MTLIEQIKAEIERRIKKHNEKAVFKQGYREGLTQLLSFINSLQQEQPKVDLEKEIDNFLNETGAPYVWCNDDEQKEWCEIIARHFAQWQKKQLLEKTYLHGWVARNDYALNNDYLLLFKEKPTRNNNFGWKGSLFMRLDESWFRELEWTDEPIKVKIIIVKENEK